MSLHSTSQAPAMALTHAGLALLLLVGGLLLGGTLVPVLLLWPFYLLAPLAAYLLIALVLPSFRHSLKWLRLGRLDRGVLTWTAAIIIVSSVALVIWHRLVNPDVADILAHLPPWNLPGLLAVGVVFSLVNALLEEMLFRGLLFDALRASYGVTATLLFQALAFGSLHMAGFPSGASGVVLASVYGLMLGTLRLYAGGLAACWAAHVCADATIFALLLEHVL